MSEGILQEIKAVWKGHSFKINVCIQEVKALERDPEVCPSEMLLLPTFKSVQINCTKILKRWYYSWS